MGLKVRLFAGMGLGFLLLGFLSCTTTATANGTLLVVTSNNVVTSFLVALSDGAVTAVNATAPTGVAPVAALLSSDGNQLFVLNQGDNTISAYKVNSDGSVTAAGSATPTNSAFSVSSPCASIGDGTTSNPVAMTMDSAGHLFVANSGTTGSPGDPSTMHAGAVSVFAVSGTSLSEVPGSPFCTLLPSEVSAGQVTNSPSAVAVTPDAKYLYAASLIDKTVISYSVDSSGAITEILQRQNVGTNPSGLIIVSAPNSTNPQGEFLYVANAGSNNVSGFAICDAVVVSCANPNEPDGSLTEVSNSPFSAGIGPMAMAASPDGQFLFVVNAQSNQISQFKVSVGTGALVANTQAAIGTGGNPVSIAIRLGTTIISSTNGTEDFVFVMNRGGATMFSYSFDSTLGQLTEITPTATQGQPSAAVVK